MRTVLEVSKQNKASSACWNEDYVGIDRDRNSEGSKVNENIILWKFFFAFYAN